MKAVKKYNDGGVSGMGAVHKEKELQKELRTSPIPKRKKKRRTVTKGGFEVEIDGKTYVVDAKMVESIRRDGTVKKRKFKTKPRYGEAPSAPARIKDVTRYPKQ